MRSPNITEIRRVLEYARPPRAALVSSGAMFAVVAIAGALPPLFAARIIDALTQHRAGTAVWALVWYAVATVAVAIAQLASAYFTSLTRESAVANVRIALMHKLDRALLEAVSELTLGEIANRISGDVDDLCNQLEYTVLPTVQGIVTIVVTAAVMLGTNVTLSLIAFAAVALVIVPLRIVAPRLNAQQRTISAVRDDLVGAINETASLGALQLLRDPRARERERSRFSSVSFRLRSLHLRQFLTVQLASFATTLAGLMGPVALLGVGTALLISHHLGSVGIVIAFLMFYNRLSAPIGSLSSLPLQLAEIGVIAHRLMDIFSLPDEGGGVAPYSPGNIELREVEVARGGRSVLRGANLTIERGSHVALLGASGGGKSTLASLIPRFHDPTRGEVRIGGIPLASIDLESLRMAVALVSQDHAVFDASLWDNLTFTNPQAHPTEVAAVIAMCELEEVVARLKADGETRLGQRGFRLSGGERARVCLARALLGEPDILILDEALASVELDMEIRIMERIRGVMRGRTILVITHRPQSVRAFDERILVGGGRVAAYDPMPEVVA